MLRLFRRKPETTSPEIATLAAKGLKYGRSALTDEQFKRVCASDLTQAGDRAASDPN